MQKRSNAHIKSYPKQSRNMKQDWQPVEEPLRKWVDWLISTETVPEDFLKVALELFPAPIKVQAKIAAVFAIKLNAIFHLLSIQRRYH